MVGRPVRIVINDLTWDEDIQAHLARHGVTVADVMAVARSDFLGFENLPERGGSHVMIGPDVRGRILYISIRATAIPGVWEPVTGWESRKARTIWVSERGGEGDGES